MMLATPSFEVYEDDSTVPRRKKRRSSAGRRVSFAETKTVHIFQRDDEYATPPAPSPRRSPRLAQKKAIQSPSPSPLKNSDDIVSIAEPDDGPVDMDHLNDTSSVVEDDITLDSTTFSSKFNEVVLQENQKSPWSSDMSFTDQQRRRPLTPIAARQDLVSPSASVDKCLTMQYTEVVNAGTLAQRRRRVFKGSPCAKKLRLEDSAEKDSPERSPFRRPLEDITTSFLLQAEEIEAELPATPVPTLAALLNRDEDDQTTASALDQTISSVIKERNYSVEKGRSPFPRTLGYNAAELVVREDTEYNAGALLPVSTEKEKPFRRPLAELGVRQEVNAGPVLPRRSPFRRPLAKLGDRQEVNTGLLLPPLAELHEVNVGPLPPERSTPLARQVVNTGLFPPERSPFRRPVETRVEEGATGSIPRMYIEEVQMPLEDLAIVRAEDIAREREDRKARIAALRLENQESCEKIVGMKEKLEALNEMIKQHSSAAAAHKSELKKTCVLQKIQGWQSTKISSKQNLQTLDTNYGHRVNQRITIERNEFATIELSPNTDFIETAFPRTNAALLFQTLLPQQKITVRPLKRLSAALERASSVVMTLLHVAREAVECRVEYRCLNTVVFFDDSACGICLRFSFESYRMRVKVTLSFQLQQLTCGEYPRDILPSSVTLEIPPQSKITEEELKRAISSLPAGFRRFHRICACVSSFFLTESDYKYCDIEKLIHGYSAEALFWNILI